MSGDNLYNSSPVTLRPRPLFSAVALLGIGVGLGGAVVCSLIHNYIAAGFAFAYMGASISMYSITRRLP